MISSLFDSLGLLFHFYPSLSVHNSFLTLILTFLGFSTSEYKKLFTNEIIEFFIRFIWLVELDKRNGYIYIYISDEKYNSFPFLWIIYYKHLSYDCVLICNGWIGRRIFSQIKMHANFPIFINRHFSTLGTFQRSALFFFTF